jgi:hypothetical protein
MQGGQEAQMYCNRCGNPLSAAAQFCAACGERVLGVPVAHAVAPGTTMAAGAGSRVRRDVGLLAALWMVSGILRLLGVLSFSVFGHWFLPGIFGPGMWSTWGFPWRGSMWLWSMGFTWIVVILGVFGALHLVLAWGLYERKQWSRPLGLVLGVLALLRFPLGTALGIYTLWVLLPETNAREYEQIAVL